MTRHFLQRSHCTHCTWAAAAASAAAAARAWSWAAWDVAALDRGAGASGLRYTSAAKASKRGDRIRAASPNTRPSPGEALAYAAAVANIVRMSLQKSSNDVYQCSRSRHRLPM